MKRGLKGSKQILHVRVVDPVEEYSPMKRGLKARAHFLRGDIFPC